MTIGEGNKGEGEYQEEEKYDKKNGEDENEEEHQIRSKRKAGVLFGLTPSSDALWDAELEKKVDGGKAGGHKNGLKHKRMKRIRARRGKMERRRNRRNTKDKDWKTLPDIWMTLGKQVQSFVSCFFSNFFDLFVCLLPSQRSSRQFR